MGRHTKSLQAGLSAVELLVTLVVASMFIVTGYSLYAFVLKDGATARAEAKASSVANEYLETYRIPSNTCTASTPHNNESIVVSGLTSVNITVVKSCPDGTVAPITKIEVTMTYNTPQKTIALTTYAGPEI